MSFLTETLPMVSEELWGTGNVPEGWYENDKNLKTRIYRVIIFWSISDKF
jgi:hypothetical protein